MKIFTVVIEWASEDIEIRPFVSRDMAMRVATELTVDYMDLDNEDHEIHPCHDPEAIIQYCAQMTEVCTIYVYQNELIE